MIKVLSIFGTRPEAIKMAPIIREFAKHADRVESKVCVTAQHREMLDQVLEFFQIKPDYDLNLMEPLQTLSALTARILMALDRALSEIRPDWVLIQGDTTTVLAASLASFYHNVRIGHVEAGLRTHDKRAPFPEEINRRVTSVIADLHFAPTEHARQMLLQEGVPEKSIFVTGNTIVDALHWAKSVVDLFPPPLPQGLREAIDGKRLILVTGHRRENFGKGLMEICFSLCDLARKYSDIVIVYPVHLNPNVKVPVYRILGRIPSVFLLEPLPYASFVWLMSRAYLILTDSGGVQEEAPSLGKPVIVMREKTERPEGIAGGNVCLAGTERHKIIDQAVNLLETRAYYDQMSVARNLYGDGHAAARIVKIIIGSNPP